MLLASFSLAILLSGPIQAPQQEKPKFEMATFQFVILRPGPKEKSLKAEDKAKMQMEHLKRLQELWESREALVAGPVTGNPEVRGIAILDVRTKEEGVAIMKDDPFVRAGALVAEVRPWLAGKDVVKKGPQFMDLQPMWLGLLKRPKDAPTLTKEKGEEIQAGHMANINKMAAEGALVWAGPFLEDTPLRGMFLFYGLPKGRIEELANRDPAIKAHRLELELMPWHTPKGSWPEPVKAGG